PRVHVELRAERIDEESKLAAALAKGLGPRAGTAAAPVAHRDVDAVSGVERAIGHGGDQALEPGPHLAAWLEGEPRHRRLALRLETHRGVLSPLGIGELRLAPVGGEARGDLESRALVIAVGADLVGQGPAAPGPGDHGRVRRDPRATDEPRIGVDRHQAGPIMAAILAHAPIGAVTPASGVRRDSGRGTAPLPRTSAPRSGHSR